MDKVIIVCTSGFHETVTRWLENDIFLSLSAVPHPNYLIIEVDEKIDQEGIVQIELSEPAINKALRSIFKFKDAYILIALHNSKINPIHARNLLHVLNAAGYANTLAAGIPVKTRTTPPPWLYLLLQKAEETSLS